MKKTIRECTKDVHWFGFGAKNLYICLCGQRRIFDYQDCNFGEIEMQNFQIRKLKFTPDMALGRLTNNYKPKPSQP